MSFSNIKKYNKYLICFILLFVLCWFFPYTGDDWAWGSSIGIERLSNWFDNYSGRYFGNLIVLALTRSNILKSVVMSFVIVGTLFCIEKITKNKWAFWLSAALLSVLPRLILRQSIIWTSGFSNYATSIFLTLIYVLYINKIFEDNNIKQKPIHCIPLLILGFLNTLIVEHLTIYNVVLGIFVIIFTIFKYKKIFIQHISYLLGTISGTILMFSNSVYHSIQTGADGYRSVASGGIIKQALGSYLDVIYNEAFMNNIWINLVVLIICSLLYWNLKKSNNNKKALSIIKYLLIGLSIYIIYSFFSIIGLSGITKTKHLIYLEGIFTFVAIILMFVCIFIISLKYKKNTLKICFIMGSIVCLIVPLFVVNPIGSRCFYATYIMFILLICELLKLLPEEKYKIYLDVVEKICILVCSVIFIIYLAMFYSINKVDKSRLNYVKNKINEGSTKVEVLHLPYENYIWTGTPTVEPWITRYKLFYNLPSNIDLVSTYKYSKKVK